MTELIFFALGGAAGAFCRFWTGLAAASLFGTRFPLGTLIVNVVGCFIIGASASAIQAGRLSSDPWNALLMQGFCGALTTFSTFSLESFQLFRRGRVWSGWVNLLFSMALCLSAAVLGLSMFSAETALTPVPVHP